MAPHSARSCSKMFYNIIYNIIIPDSDLFSPSTYLNSQESITTLVPDSIHLVFMWDWFSYIQLYTVCAVTFQAASGVLITNSI